MRRRRPLPRYMAPGGFTDIATMSGNVKFIIIGLSASLALWNTHHIVDWIYSILEMGYMSISAGQIRTHKFWGGLLGCSTITIGVAQMLWLYWCRRQAIKSAVGQWYDRDDLNRSDLHDN